MATARRHLRLVETQPVAKPEAPQPMPIWQAWGYAHWYVSWSIARAVYESWDRAMSGRRE